MRMRVLTVGLLLLIPVVALGQDASSLVDGKLEKLAGGFEFTEGPSADAKGNVYFTDQPNDRILIWSIDNKLSTFLQPAGRSNGLCFDAKGRLWACADEKNELWVIDVGTKKHTVVVKDYQGKLFNGPNDVWVRPDGGIYFTDPFYKRKYWKRGPSEQDQQAVYFLEAEGKGVRRVADGFKQPNGLVGSADGKTLFVTDIGGGKTYSYAVESEGTLANKQLFCNQGADGMTLDEKGNLYLAGRNVTVFDRMGKKVETIAVPEVWSANVCFGGADMRTLFVTAGKSLYGIRMKVPGASRQ